MDDEPVHRGFGAVERPVGEAVVAPAGDTSLWLKQSEEHLALHHDP